MSTRLKQCLIAVVGAAIAVAMLWLGLWQMQVFESKENSSAVARAAQPAVPLVDFVGTDGTVGDIYGKQVTVTGTYLARQQAGSLIPTGTVRVLDGVRGGRRPGPAGRPRAAAGWRPPFPAPAGAPRPACSCRARVT